MNQNISTMTKTNQFKTFLIATLIAVSGSVFAQVKIGDNPSTINAGSVLELESTNKGLLLPRIALTNTTTWSLLGTPVAGMQVYNTNLAITSTNTAYPTLAAKKGQYYWDGTGWVALVPLAKLSAVYSFQQSAGVTIPIQPTAGPVCGSWNCSGGYSKYLNWEGTFTTIQAINDVVLDLTGNYSLASNNTQVQFHFFVVMDKTTPGVFEQVHSFFVNESGIGCTGNEMNYKTVLQNLPPRLYTVRIYAAVWSYPIGPQTAILGVGAESLQGYCGNNNPENQKLIITVSQ